MKRPLAFGERHEHPTIFKSILHADDPDHRPVLLTQRHRTTDLGIEEIRGPLTQHHPARIVAEISGTATNPFGTIKPWIIGGYAKAGHHRPPRRGNDRKQHRPRGLDE